MAIRYNVLVNLSSENKSVETNGNWKSNDLYIKFAIMPTVLILQVSFLHQNEAHFVSSYTM